MNVWIIEGWFGDREWIEAVYADEEKANSRVEELWEERRSFVLPEDHFYQRLCKFAAIEHRVVE